MELEQEEYSNEKCSEKDMEKDEKKDEAKVTKIAGKEENKKEEKDKSKGKNSSEKVAVSSSSKKIESQINDDSEDIQHSSKAAPTLLLVKKNDQGEEKDKNCLMPDISKLNDKDDDQKDDEQICSASVKPKRKPKPTSIYESFQKQQMLNKRLKKEKEKKLNQQSKQDDMESNNSISDDVKLQKRRYSNYDNDDEKIRSGKKR